MPQPPNPTDSQLLGETQRLFDSLSGASRFARIGFVLLWIFSAILGAYLLLYRFNYNQALLLRTSDQLDIYCQCAQPPSGVPADGATEDANSRVPWPFGEGLCNPPAFAAWLSSPCSTSSRDHYIDLHPREETLGETDENKVSCAEFKANAGATYSKWSRSLGDGLLKKSVSFPLLNIELSLIDFIFLSPIFVIVILIWLIISLSFVVRTVQEFMGIDGIQPCLLAYVLPANFMILDVHESRKRRTFNYLSCLAPALVMTGLFITDLLDLFVGKWSIGYWLWELSDSSHLAFILLRECALGVFIFFLFYLGVVLSDKLTAIRLYLGYYITAPGIVYAFQDRLKSKIRESGDAATSGLSSRINEVSVSVIPTLVEGNLHFGVEMSDAPEDQRQWVFPFSSPVIIGAPNLSRISWTPPRSAKKIADKLLDIKKFKKELDDRIDEAIPQISQSFSNHHGCH